MLLTKKHLLILGMHARAKVEKGVKWITDKAAVEGDEAKNIGCVG